MPPANINDKFLSVEGVTLQYRADDRLVTATRDVSFGVQPRDRFVLLGPSGSGKSSLLKAMGGFINPVFGRIRLENRVIDGPGPDRMMVFQEFDQLLPWKTVVENVMFPMTVGRRFTRAQARARALELIDTVRLTQFRDAFPHTLSGGMKQRVAIARALAPQPAVLLMDEPFAALDALTRQKMQAELIALWERDPFTLVFVTHSIEEALIVGSRILVLSPHPGQVKAELNAHEFGFDDQGTSAFVAQARRIHDLLFASDGGPHAG